MGVGLWAIGEQLWWMPMDDGVHGEGGTKCVSMEDIEDVVFVHEGLCVCVVPPTRPCRYHGECRYHAPADSVSPR